jgi:hypothetical protein
MSSGVWVHIRIRVQIGIETMPILMRMQPKVLHMLENQNFFLLLVTASPLYNVLSFSSVSNVSYVFSILDGILKFSGKKSTLSTFFICLELIPIRFGRILISMPWMPIPIRSRQNYADPTRSGSGSTTPKVDNRPLFLIFFVTIFPQEEKILTKC